MGYWTIVVHNGLDDDLIVGLRDGEAKPPEAIVSGRASVKILNSFML